MGPSLNAVLSDIHQIASGVGATVAVLSDLSNGKSPVAYRPARRSSVDRAAALKCGAFPASVGIDRRSANGAMQPDQHRRSSGLSAIVAAARVAQRSGTKQLHRAD